MEKYEPISFIGKGNFGSITKIKRKIDGKILVWKELNYGLMKEKDKNRIVQEVNILHELHHPNIVKYYDRIIDKKNTKLFIVMEYCPGGDLSQLIKHNRKTNQYFSEDIIWKIFSQVSSALYACHTHKEGKILHRDIKPSNIFIDQENNIKLGDFGLSRILNNDISFAVSRVGTPYYMSPEQIEDIKYNEKSDIWSLGCFLYELTTLHPPFEASTHLNLAKKIKSGKIDEIPNFYSNKLNEIIKLLMNLDPNKRPNINEIMAIPEINLRIKEKRIKENMKKIKKMENLFKIREVTIKEKEEELIIKQKYLNEREKNLNEREEYIKRKEEEFLKSNENKFNTKDLSITTDNFNFKCLKIVNNNNFMMSNFFSYKNKPLIKEQRNNNAPFMNHTDNHFFKNKENKQNNYYTTYNTNHNIKIDSTQNASYNNVNNRNDSTQNASYNANNKNESTQNVNNNIISNTSEINSNYILYKPYSEERNINKHIGTSPNTKAIVYNYNIDQNQTRNSSNNNKFIDNYKSNYSYDNEHKKNKCKIFNQKEINNDENSNNYNKKENTKDYKDYIAKKFSKNNSNNKSNKHKKSEKCINDKQNQNFNDKNINNNHTINFNNVNNIKYIKGNKNQINSPEEIFNDYLSERFYEKNSNHSININKNLLYKLTSTPQLFSKEKLNYCKPESNYYPDYNRKIKIYENIDLDYENEKFNNDETMMNNYPQKHNSFNGINVKKNYYRKSNIYNTKKVIKVNYKKSSNNLNTINF